MGKTKLLGILMVMLMLVASVSAQVFIEGITSSPQPPSPVEVKVIINGQKLDHDGFVINHGSGEKLDLKVHDGFALFDLSQFKEGVFEKSRAYSGDVLEMEVCSVHADCTVRYNVLDKAPKRLEVIISDESIVLPDPIVVEKEVFKEVEVEKEVVVEKEVIVEKEVPVDEEESLYDKIFALALKLLAAFGFGAGFLGLVNYYWHKGQKPRALKMLNTAIKKALLGEYDKHKK